MKLKIMVLKSVVGAVVALFFVVANAHAAPVSLSEINWDYYQYGYVSNGPEFRVSQSHWTGRDGVANVVGNAIEGASMESRARLSWYDLSSRDIYSLSVDFSIVATALVDEGYPEGRADAGGSLSLLGIGFEVSETVLASFETSSSGPIYGDFKNSPSAFLINPGLYSFLYGETFGIDAEAHVSQSPGFASASASYYFNFAFQKVPAIVPAPGVFLLFGAGLLGIAAVRNRRSKAICVR